MDESLVARAQAGDRAALARLLEEVAPLVHRFGLRMCRHAADAEDVLQDTLLAVASHLGEFRGQASLSSWVFTLARTACARRRRGLKNQPHLPEDAARDAIAAEHDPAQTAEQRELSRAVDEALSTLSEEHREVLLSATWRGSLRPRWPRPRA
jgi:RNA polymerase sigma-70 factor, ECF subfamily